jgi:hypothetical protein
MGFNLLFSFFKFSRTKQVCAAVMPLPVEHKRRYRNAGVPSKIRTGYSLWGIRSWAPWLWPRDRYYLFHYGQWPWLVDYLRNNADGEVADHARRTHAIKSHCYVACVNSRCYSFLIISVRCSVFTVFNEERQAHSIVMQICLSLSSPVIVFGLMNGI